MHELSIAQNIVELSEQQAKNHQAEAIEEIRLEIGALAGVEVRSLEFALESCIKNSMLEKARIVLHDIEGEGRCGDCGKVFKMSSLLDNCPACGSYLINVVKGKELKVKSLLVKK
jgi:hydrogenase nickel incorporation protein HypA/HybF